MIGRRTTFRIRFLFLFIVVAGQHLASAQDFRGKTVTAIEYSPASQPIDPRDLQRAQMVQVGQPLDPRQVATSIDRLFRTGLFEDIQVDAEPSGDGVLIRFITRPQRFIGHVGAGGKISEPPNRAAIISDAQLYLGTPFDEEALETARKNLEQEMHDNGLFEATVGTMTIEDPVTHDVTIRFIVNAGKRARYTTPIITGDTKLSDNTIIKATGWRWPVIHRWRQVTAALTDKGVSGVQSKYAKKGRLTASVNLTDLNYNSDTNRAQPHLDITAGPTIDIKVLEAKVSKGKLKQLVPVYQEGAVDNDLLTEGARNIHDYFQSKGYPDVDVTFRREGVQNDKELINYYVASGPRRRLVNITILGNTYFLPDTIRERMFLKTNSILMRYGRYSEAFRHNDERAIEALYLASGFRDVKVTSSVETNYKGKENDIGVTYRINPGTQWKVASLAIEGSARLDVAPLRSQLASSEGQPFAEVNIASDRNRVLECYYSHGFPSASFSYSVSNAADPNTIALVYRVREGPQQFVRSVVISGLYRTRESLVRRYIDVHEGEPISLIKINDNARLLNSLGIFANVNTALQDADRSNRYKYVLYDFDEAARYAFQVGLGMYVGQFGHTTNNLNEAGGAKGVSPIISFNVNRLNFRGTGQTISLQTNYSTLQQRYSLNYIIPRFLGSLSRTLTFALLYQSTQDVQTFSSQREEASVQTSQKLNRASTILFRFAYRRVSTSNINIPVLLIPLYSQPVRIGMLSASYIQDHRDNPGDAHRGFWNTLDAGIAGNFLGSQRNFVRVLARNATYTSLGRNLVFARQTQFGFIQPFNKAININDFDVIPLPERFFGGGGVSMRGFGDNQAGPRDIGTITELPGQPVSTPTGFPIGGNALFFNTVELRFPLLGPNISGVVFEDMGNIYTTPNALSLAYHQGSNQNFNYAVQAPGFGIRYRTPVGPVRVDFSYALNPPRYLGFNRNETLDDLLQCTPSEVGVLPQCTATPQRLSHFNFFFSIGQAF